MAGDETPLGGGGAGASATVLDDAAIRALDELTGGDRDVVADLVGAFLEDAPARLRDLAAGLGQGDLALAGRAAHTLKSNAYTFGASALGDACKALEAAAGNGDAATATVLAEHVRVEWSRASPALDALRRGAG